MNMSRFSSGRDVSDAGGVSSPVPAPSTLRQRLGKRHENRKHLEYVAGHGCMICGGPVQVHHLLRPWSGIRATSRKSGDENTVPLCLAHHTALHKRGDEDAWSFEQWGHVSALRAEAERLWLASPHYVDLTP